MAVLDTQLYLDAVCRMLQQGHSPVPVPIRGDSMRPFLRSGDFAYLGPLPQTIRPGDMLLFQRPDDRYILHRVYRCLPDGTCLMLGDGQLMPEPVAPDRLRGKVLSVRCAGQLLKPGDFRWWFYQVPWRILGPNRGPVCALREKFR